MKKIALLFAGFIILLSSCDFFNVTKGNSDEELVTGISFSAATLTVNTGTDEYLPMTIYPISVQNKVNVNWEYDQEAIEINPDSYGVVIKGLQPQSSYIKASINGYTATCILTIVASDNYIGNPYIYANNGIVEMQPNSSQNISVSLMGGTIVDYSEFTWSSSNNTVADISSAMNNCVVRSYKTGTAQITVNHPKAKYPFTFLVHSYTDDVNEPFLSTNMNIVTVNKTESATKNIIVSLQNGANSQITSKYKWEIDSNGEPPCISVSGNGDSAIVTALSNGMNRIKITHEDCNYPLYILVRVTTAIQNVYVTTNVSTLEVIGSVLSYTITADLSGFYGFYDKSKFIWEIPDNTEDYFNYYVYEDNLSINGKKNGAFKIKVSHELSDFARTILIVLREQDGSKIDNSMYITTDQNYIQTKIGGDTIPVLVTLVGGFPGDENNFIWTIDGGQNNVFVTLETPHGHINSRSALGSLIEGTLYITPLSTGSCTISVSHPKISYSTDITVKVFSQYAQLEEPMFITSSTASLKMLGGSSQPLSVSLSGNFSPADEADVQWDSSNQNLVSFTPSTGVNVILSVNYGFGEQQTYLTVDHSKAQSSKRILLLSADTQEALNAMKAIYADQTYYRTNVNSTINLSITGVGIDPSDIIDWTASPQGIVIVEKNSSDQLSASITGISSGSASVSASIRGSSAVPCDLTFIVLPEGEDTGTISAKYLSTPKNAVLLQNIGDYADVSVYGVGIPSSELYRTQWSGYNASVINVSANGSTASINALDFGATKIKVSHPDSDADLFIDVKIGALYEWADDFYPYITVENDVVLMIKGEKNKAIGASLVNSSAIGGFSFKLNPSNSPVAVISGITTGICTIDAIEAGMCEIIISNSNCDFDREILLVVANTPEELAGFHYLTTSQNVVTLPLGTPTSVTVSVPTVTNPPSGSFTWSSDNSAVSVVSSGHYAVVTGQKMGTSVITVRQNDCDYPLEIIANCVDPKIASLTPFISSPNILTLRVGEPMSSVAAELVGGNPSDNTSFQWSTPDPTIIDLYGSNENAQIRAKREGISQIRIFHPRATPNERTILVICEPKLSADYAINCSENIVRMSPSDGARTITATLVNGTSADAYGFKWWADSYDIIDFNYTSNTCVITPKSTGTTYVHVSHPKSSYARDILIQISQFSEFKFNINNLSIPEGTQSFVNLQVPAFNFSSRVDYKAIDPTTGQNSNKISASGTNSVCTVNAHAAGNVILEASLLNTNNGIVQATAQLLVNVTPSTTPETYINYTGPTIITVEKGATREISATLAGLNATTGDNSSLQWKTSDWFNDNGTINSNRAVNISPTPSASGIATNNSIQITGLNDGSECTVTISHSKANSNIILYVIIPGSNAANISLSTGSARYCIVGDSVFNITATITNPQDNDYELLQWELEQDSAVIDISGSGKNIGVLPLNPGTAKITATVPSSQRAASVDIIVEEQRYIQFNLNRVTTFPGQTIDIPYSVSPPELIDCVLWDVSDTHLVRSLEDISSKDNTGKLTGVGHNGTMQLLGWTGNGIATVTATLHPRDNKNIVLARNTITVKNGWDNVIKLNKKNIKYIPVIPDTPTIAENPFTISYEVNPYISTLEIDIQSNKLHLKEDTYSRFVPGAGSTGSAGTYFIDEPDHDFIDYETGVAYGFIQLVPTGESSSIVSVIAKNPRAINQETGEFETVTFPNEPLHVQCDIYYDKYSFNMELVSLQYNSATNRQFCAVDQDESMIVVTDGNTLNFKIWTDQENANPDFVILPSNDYFKPNTSESTSNYSWLNNYKGNKDQKYKQGLQISAGIANFSNNTYFVSHNTDYRAQNDQFSDKPPWGFLDSRPIDQYNTAQVGFIYAGTVEIPYKTYNASSASYFKIRVYVSIHNCAVNY